jgi:AbrB family looped-hinge helix DNA binding protein
MCRTGEEVMETIMNSKGQIIIPFKIREQLGIKDGTYIQIDLNTVTRQLILTPITRDYIHSLRGKYKGKGLMNSLIAEKKRAEV